MNKALHDAQPAHETAVRGTDWRKSMSNHVASALLVYTGIHIFATVGALNDVGLKMGALFALCVLVAGIIPALRKFESRWTTLSDEEAADPGKAPAFRRDLVDKIQKHLCPAYGE